MINNRGKIVIISSPSGGGKTSICQKLLTSYRKRKGWCFSISYTTRQKRPNERNGREYYFVSEKEFIELTKKDYFAEYFRVHLYFYGTPRKPLEKVVNEGGVMILDVDVQGAFKLKKEYPEAITIFVLPPSIEELRKRLKARGTESKEQLNVRFENAKKEMQHFKNFEYSIINQDLDEAVKHVLCAIDSHHLRSEHLAKEQIRKLLV